jgi:hypothetical protein
MADEPFSQSPFVFEEQDASQLRKPVRAVLKGAEDRFPIEDGERPLVGSHTRTAFN